MDTSTCDLCDNPAVIHETVARMGIVKIRHLCRAHGLKLWRDSVVPAAERLANNARKSPVKTPITVPPTALRHDG